MRAFEYWRNVDENIGDRIEKAVRDKIGGKSTAPGMASAKSIKKVMADKDGSATSAKQDAMEPAE